MAVANTGSRVDTIYRAAIQAPKFFTKGWGDVRLLERIFKLMKQVKYPKGESWKCGDGSLIDRCFGICQQSDIKMLGSGKNGIADVFQYEFRSPLNTILPGSLPKESEKVRFQLVIPHSWFDGRNTSNGERRPVCIHLAGTGDHFYWRRRHFMALPLAKENGVASIIVENPFYGSRRPKGQNKSGLRHVSDLFVMGAALTFEVMALLDWCEKQGYGPLAVTGISMGGHMASISATVWNKPIAIVPCLSWSTAAPVFTKGVMKYSVSWKTLQEQLQAKPEYLTLLEKYCPKYAEFAKDKKRNFGEAHDLHPLDMESSGKKDLLQLIGRNNGLMVDNYGTNLYYSKRLRNYDVDKKKLGIFAVDFDSLLKLDNISANLVSNITGRLNFDLLKQYSLIDIWSSSNITQDTFDYMDYILHQLTDLENFTHPHSDSAVIFVSANHDSYVPMSDIRSPADIWTGSEMRSIDCGHVMGVLRYQKIFRDAIRDALSRI